MNNISYYFRSRLSPRADRSSLHLLKAFPMLSLDLFRRLALDKSLIFFVLRGVYVGVWTGSQ